MGGGKRSKAIPMLMHMLGKPNHIEPTKLTYVGKYAKRTEYANQT